MCRSPFPRRGQKERKSRESTFLPVMRGRIVTGHRRICVFWGVTSGLECFGLGWNGVTGGTGEVWRGGGDFRVVWSEKRQRVCVVRKRTESQNRGREGSWTLREGGRERYRLSMESSLKWRSRSGRD